MKQTGDAYRALALCTYLADNKEPFNKQSSAVVALVVHDISGGSVLHASSRRILSR